MPADLNEFARRYARAWCSQRPEEVASFFAEGGSLTVNEGVPAVGRGAIAQVARSFMTDFPDMVVTMDRLVPTDRGAEFHWTLTGTNAGPAGTGKRVRISGYEEWQFGADGLVAESRGHFDAADYARQIEQGTDG
jgi:predicted ester cyclase